MKVAANVIVYFQNCDQILSFSRDGVLKNLNVSLFFTIGQIKSKIMREEHAGRKYHYWGFFNCLTPVSS